MGPLRRQRQRQLAMTGCSSVFCNLLRMGAPGVVLILRHTQDSAGKEEFLPPPSGRGALFTKPRNYSLAELCTYDVLGIQRSNTFPSLQQPRVHSDTRRTRDGDRRPVQAQQSQLRRARRNGRRRCVASLCSAWKDGRAASCAIQFLVLRLLGMVSQSDCLIPLIRFEVNE